MWKKMGSRLSKTRNSDASFLEQTDKAWKYLFTLAAVLLSPIVNQLLTGFSTYVLAVFRLLLGIVLLPFGVEIWGIMSGSAKIRFYSWSMLILCIIATGSVYMYGGIWRVYLKPLLVPNVMSLSSFILLTSVISSTITCGSMRYSIGRLIHHFRANLKEKSYREQIPVFHSLEGRIFVLILGLYTVVEFYAVWFLLH